MKSERPQTISLTAKGVVMHADAHTARVKVARTKIHPIYKKRFTAHSQLAADIPAGMEIVAGDMVVVKPSRRLSKTKFWVVKEKTS